VVVVSSIAARRGALGPGMTVDVLVSPPAYDPRQVYANSKQANLLLAQELHRRAAAAGSPVSVVAAHPGVSWTNLFARQMKDEGRGWMVPLVQLARPFVFQSAAAGALPTLRALDKSTPSGSFVGPSALFQLRGKPELLDVYASAQDEDVAARLCDLTEEVLGTPLPV
jgi:NAD(P)-dependent dehydrogenase (short-subunit alcohol dehydrogenase family)